MVLHSVHFLFLRRLTNIKRYYWNWKVLIFNLIFTSISILDISRIVMIADVGVEI